MYVCAVVHLRARVCVYLCVFFLPSSIYNQTEERGEQLQSLRFLIQAQQYQQLPPNSGEARQLANQIWSEFVRKGAAHEVPVDK